MATGYQIALSTITQMRMIVADRQRILEEINEEIRAVEKVQLRYLKPPATVLSRTIFNLVQASLRPVTAPLE